MECCIKSVYPFQTCTLYPSYLQWRASVTAGVGRELKPVAAILTISQQEVRELRDEMKAAQEDAEEKVVERRKDRP